MRRKPLVRLINDLEKEMLRLGYTQGTMKFYRRRWHMLIKFAQEREETYYSEQMGLEFVEKHFHILEKDFKRSLSQSEIQELRVIRLIGDYQLHHTVLRRYYKHKKILTDPHFIATCDQFKKYCEKKIIPMLQLIIM
jgi:integrase/recombinase XerD